MLNFSKTHVVKIVSGGQTGADRAGLEAAKQLGIATGGFAPLHFRTQNGNDYSLKDFHLEEDSSYHYAPRTAKNIKASDGTIIIALNLNSPGCSLTKKYAAQFKKPVFLVQLSSSGFYDLEDVNSAEHWVQQNQISILNVAGNREVFQNGKSLVFEPTFSFITRLLKKTNHESI